MGFKTHLIVLSMVAILWCATVFDAAAEGKYDMTEEGRKIQLATLQLHSAGEPVNPNNLEKAKRDLETVAEGNVRRFCRNNPCGWAVYVPFFRNIEYTMKNPCDCPEDWKCIRTGDDLSVSAYVYRCRRKWTDEDIVFGKIQDADYY